MKHPQCDNPKCEDGYECLYERPDGGKFCTHCPLCEVLEREDEKELEEKVAAQDAKDVGTPKPRDSRKTKRKKLPKVDRRRRSR